MSMICDLPRYYGLTEQVVKVSVPDIEQTVLGNILPILNKMLDCAPVFFRSVSDVRPHQSPIRVQGFGSCPMRAAIFRLFKTFKPLEF
jgi:hypothetical protein